MSDCALPNGRWSAGGKRTLRRFDFEARKYLPYEIPASWRVSCYESSIAEVVNCAACGRRMPFGDTFTSLRIHTANGFGYGVCGECYDEECKDKKKAAGR